MSDLPIDHFSQLSKVERRLSLFRRIASSLVVALIGVGLAMAVPAGAAVTTPAITESGVAKASMGATNVSSVAEKLGHRVSQPALAWDSRLKNYGQTKCLDFWVERKVYTGTKSNHWTYKVRNWCKKTVKYKVKISKAACHTGPLSQISKRGTWESGKWETCWAFASSKGTIIEQ